MKPNKKGMMGLEKIILSLVVVGFLLVIGLALLGNVRDQQATTNVGFHCGWNSTNGTGGTLLYDGCGAGYNASLAVVDAIDDIPTWLPIIVLAFIAVIVLGIVYMIRRNA